MNSPGDVKLRDALIQCPCGCGLLTTGTRRCTGCDREISLAHWDNLYDSCGECADRTGRAGDDR